MKAVNLVPLLWYICLDNASHEQGSKAGSLLTTLEQKFMKIKCMLHLSFKETNIKVKYEALLASLQLLQSIGFNRMFIHNDLQLIIKQVTMEY